MLSKWVLPFLWKVSCSTPSNQSPLNLPTSFIHSVGILSLYFFSYLGFCKVSFYVAFWQLLNFVSISLYGIILVFAQPLFLLFHQLFSAVEGVRKSYLEKYLIALWRSNPTRGIMTHLTSGIPTEYFSLLKPPNIVTKHRKNCANKNTHKSCRCSRTTKLLIKTHFYII